jgi:murein DD-endopeptidase MepM/ murein hydrolase activator NlpD
LALLGALASALPGFAAVTDYPFRLVTRADGTDQQLVAENNGPAPITVYVTLTGENFASDRDWPITSIVPPYTAQSLGRVYAAEKNGGGYNFLFRYSHHFGRIDAIPDPDAVYRLPYEEGQGYTISQAYGGKLTSHNNRENLYAVDFAMPVGTPVLASRAGIVIDATLRHREGGYDIKYLDKANTVAIAHDDGTVAEYAHLSPGTEIVKVGERVEAGVLIGYSGSTGYSSGPHLHFIVSRPTVNEGKVTRVSLPVLFYASDPAARFSAQAGTTVTANYKSSAVAQRPNNRVDANSTATGLTSLDPPERSQ